VLAHRWFSLSCRMDEHLELWSGGDSRLVPLGSDNVSIGRGDTNDIALPFDPTVSRLHAVIVRYHGGWCVRDVGSANGTYLNSQRLLSEQLLRPGDEIRVGAARIVFRSELTGMSTQTVQASDQVPELTKREHDVLLALCRPLLGAETFAQPASNRTIAQELTIGEAGVTYHLVNLYEKFRISADEGSRRARLADEAIRRGAVSRSEL
jgi:pSer/pThr/pTyr-binding forkhead associated (FHA) protein